MGKLVRTVVAALVVATALSGCNAGDDGGSGSYRAASDDTEVPALEEALALAPSDTSHLQFWSDRHAAERLGLLGDTFDSADAQATRYEDALADVRRSDYAALGKVSESMRIMAEGDAPFTPADVRWTMRLSTGPTMEDSETVLVYRLVDGVDTAALADDLVDAGFESTDLDDGWVRFHMDGMMSEKVDVVGGNVLAGRYPGDFFPELRLQSDESLLVVGEGDGSELLEVDGGDVTPERLGLPTGDDLEQIEYFDLMSGSLLTCWRPLEILRAGHPPTPTGISEWVDQYDLTSIGRPAASILRWVPGEPVLLQQFFSDPATARRSYQGRQRLYAGEASRTRSVLGALIPSGAGGDSPYELGWSMKVAGREIDIEHNATDPASAIAAHSQRGVGFDACDPTGSYPEPE